MTKKAPAIVNFYCCLPTYFSGSLCSFLYFFLFFLSLSLVFLHQNYQWMLNITTIHNSLSLLSLSTGANISYFLNVFFFLAALLLTTRNKPGHDVHSGWQWDRIYLLSPSTKWQMIHFPPNCLSYVDGL